MDLGDMGVTSSFGSNFIFVLTDIFTRFTVIRCIPDKNATTIARELLHVFSLFGWPKILTSDRGSEWLNEVVEAMINISGID
ncbi:transposase family protein, partial [Clostridioides difficile]|nr:transposase family protein [Clostridioides difficile]